MAVVGSRSWLKIEEVSVMVSGSVVVVGAVGEKVVGWGQGVKVGWSITTPLILREAPHRRPRDRGGISLTLSSPGTFA